MHSSIIWTCSWKKCKPRVLASFSHWFCLIQIDYISIVKRIRFFLIFSCIQANLKFVPNLSKYDFNDEETITKIISNPTKLRNSSLAIQLSYDWIRKNPQKLRDKSMYEYLIQSDGLKIPREIKEALVNCDWPGRCQTVRYKNLNLYIDGAHTHDSLQLCVDWFDSTTKSR